MKILITSIIDLKKSLHNRPHQFVKYLSKKHDVTVVSLNDWWKGDQGDTVHYSSEFNDIFGRIKYFYLTTKRISPLLQEVFSKKAISRILRQNSFDVHLNYNTLVSGHHAAKKLATVYDIADDLAAMVRESPQIPPFLRPFGGIYGHSMVKRNIRISKKTTMTTDGLKMMYNVPDSKSEILPNGVDSSLFKDQGRQHDDVPGSRGFTIGYVGALREWVDFEPVFSALSELDSEIRMLIVGKEGRYRETMALSRSYGLDGRVTFAGMVPYSQVPKYISTMDVCLIPFRMNMVSRNAVPLKLFEYMACERPVISARLGGVEKIAGDKVLYASSKEDYKRQISILYHSSGVGERMGLRGRKLVERDFDWAKICERLDRTMAGLPA